MLLLLVALPVFLQGVPQAERSDGKGIWARGNTVLLFTKVRPCIEEQEIPSAQILVSTDGGRSWTERGPRIEGSDFEFLHERKGNRSGLLVFIRRSLEPIHSSWLLLPRSIGTGTRFTKEPPIWNGYHFKSAASLSHEFVT
jgi:hypothetical protein